MLRFCKTALLLSLLLVFLSGCGSDQIQTAPAGGSVSFESKPITGGTITFSPINDDGTNRDGKPAIGIVGTDGKFTLKTYEEGDGAILGKHRIIYTPPEGGESEEDIPATDASGKEIGAPKKKETGIEQDLEVPESSSIVEVKEEGNEFTIALAKRTNKK
jgi:hypothetical protein